MRKQKTFVMNGGKKMIKLKIVLAAHYRHLIKNLKGTGTIMISTFYQKELYEP